MSTDSTAVLSRPHRVEGLNKRPANLADVEARLQDAFVSALAGDTAAYHAFLKELSGYLRAFFRRRLSQSRSDVEDVLQETLLAIHNSRHTYDPGQSLTAWVYAIARYKLIDFTRARQRRDLRNLSLDDIEEFPVRPDHEPLQAQLDIDKLLAQLPDRHRLPILYMKIHGLSAAEVAKRTGMSESAVKVGVHRGLKALAAVLRKSHEN